MTDPTAPQGGKRRGRWLIWTLAIIVGLPLLLLVLVSTPPVTRLVVRKMLPKINAQLNGQLTAEGIGGSLLNRLELRRVTLRDPEGEIVLQAERMDVGYSVWDILHGKITLGPLLLERPIIRLLKDNPGEQYSILRVFEKGSAEHKAAGSVDLTIRDVTLRNGAVVATIWRQPAAPQQEQAQALDTVQLQDVNLTLPLIQYSAGPSLPRAALLEIASARAFLTNPELQLDQLAGEAHLKGDSVVIALRTIQLPASKLSVDAWIVTSPGHRRFDATAHVQELTAGDIKSFVSGAEIPADWHFRGDIRTTALISGTVLVQGRNLDLTLAGGTVKGHVTVQGQDNEWTAENSRLDVAGIDVEQLLRAFHVPSNLRAQIDGVITADHQAGTADLRLAGAAGYGVRGPVNGHIRAAGNMNAMSLETQLGGSIGDVLLTGQVGMGKHLALRRLRGDVRRLNLAAVDTRLPQSNINGHLEGDVLFGSMPREGNLRLFLDSSVIRGVPIDTATVVVRLEDGLLTADTLLVRTPGLQMTGTGSFGLSEDQTGDLTLTLDAPSLRALEPVLDAFTHDSVADLDGALQLAVTASGSLKNYTLESQLHGHDVTFKGYHVDSITAAVAGTTDSLSFAARTAVDSITALNVGGRTARRPDGQLVTLDSLTIERADAVWNLDDSSSIELHGGTVRFTRAALRRSSESGLVTIAGTYPGEITVTAQRVPVADLIRKGTTPLDSMPDLDAKVTYANSVASGTVGLVTADRKPLTAEFTSTPLHARVQADSLDLSLFAPLAPSLKQVGGWLDGNVAVDGPRDAPHLDGRLELNGGRATVPATGVAYKNARAALVFSGNILTLSDGQVEAGKGRAQLSGTVRFARLDRPELQVALKTDHFPVMNRRDFLAATATGNLQLSGSPAGAVLTGSAHVNEGNAYLDKFMRSSGIDLSDPLYAQFVDTSVLRQAAGGRSIIESLMDSLRIDSMSVSLGDNFWLKSPDASIQLAGALTLSTGEQKAETEKADKYRLVGTVRAVRGLYRMTFAPGLTREFTVREGTIRYFGAPTKDAELDLSAEHLVQTATGDEVKVTAHIGGTIEKPTISLTSDVSPPLSETELISYLVFGAPTAQAFLGDQGENSQHSSVFQKSAQQLAGVLSGKIESAVVSQLGLPIDYFRIKPGEVQSGLAGTELVLGMQIHVFGYPSFLRASPRFCPREQLLSLDHIGIDLETRLSHQWGVATSIDPMQTCEAAMSGISARPYQFGFDVFWEKR
ncbi:MAG: translocation/assembly module TamB domain-containing protein [Gemmatimonadales bacterium]